MGVTAVPGETIPSDPVVFHDVNEQQLAVDQRLLTLFRLWQAKRGTRALPARADFAPDDLLPWFGNLVILDVIDGGKDFRYRLFGTVIAREAGFDMTGKLLSEYPIKQPLEYFFAVNREIVRRGTPAMSEHDPAVPAVRRRRRLILPLGKDGRTVDRILTVNYALHVVRALDRYL